MLITVNFKEWQVNYSSASLIISNTLLSILFLVLSFYQTQICNYLNEDLKTYRFGISLSLCSALTIY